MQFIVSYIVALIPFRYHLFWLFKFEKAKELKDENNAEGTKAVILFEVELEMFKGVLFIETEGFWKLRPFINIKASESCLLRKTEMLEMFALGVAIGLLKSIVCEFSKPENY